MLRWQLRYMPQHLSEDNIYDRSCSVSWDCYLKVATINIKTVANNWYITIYVCDVHVCVHLYVCVCICVLVCVHVCVCMHTCVHMRVHVCVHNCVCMYVCMCVCMCVYVYVCMFACVHDCLCACVCLHVVFLKHCIIPSRVFTSEIYVPYSGKFLEGEIFRNFGKNKDFWKYIS